MIVWVDDGLFEGNARDVDFLALLRGAALRRHTLIISTDPSASRGKRSSPKFDRWREGLTVRLAGEVDLLLERLGRVSPNAIARGAGRLLVSEHPRTAAGCWVTLEEAVRAVLLPVYILVENVINDRAFLARAMPPAWRARLDAWERAGLLRYENGGGITMMRLIVERYADDDYARRVFGLPSDLWRLVHVAVYDHDGKDAAHPSTHSQHLEKACRDAGLGDRSHRLRRRGQEHYLPREAMEAIVASRSLPHERDQRLEQIAERWASGERRHFTGLDELFKNGFGQSLAWSDEWFERDGSWAEMRLIAEKIAAAI